MFDGTPDETIDQDDQLWALTKLEEYAYRTHFHLNKEEMAAEPLEDIVINSKIMELVRKKERHDQAVIEAKSKVH